MNLITVFKYQMIFPIEIIETIAAHDWRAWGRLMATCRDLNAELSSAKAYRLFTQRSLESDHLLLMPIPSGYCYIGFRTYIYKTHDDGVEIKHIYYAPDDKMATTRVEYPLSGICLHYRREYVGAIPKYTLTKSIRMPNGGTKKIKVNPITQQEWNAVNIGL